MAQEQRVTRHHHEERRGDKHSAEVRLGIQITTSTSVLHIARTSTLSQTTKQHVLLLTKHLPFEFEANSRKSAGPKTETAPSPSPFFANTATLDCTAVVPSVVLPLNLTANSPLFLLYLSVTAPNAKALPSSFRIILKKFTADPKYCCSFSLRCSRATRKKGLFNPWFTSACVSSNDVANVRQVFLVRPVSGRQPPSPSGSPAHQTRYQTVCQ